MASWHEISDEIRKEHNNYEVVRQRYLNKFREHRNGRDVIAYYSGFLHRDSSNDGIDDRDKNAFMSLSIGRRVDEATGKEIRAGVEHRKGLDLILHTPGGVGAAAESLMHFLLGLYRNDEKGIDGDVEVFVPQLALSAGTIMACGARVIHMGTYSSLGPIDSHINGTFAWAVLEEFRQFQKEVTEKPERWWAWEPIISKYPLGFIEKLRKMNEVSGDIARKLLMRPQGMFAEICEEEDRRQKAEDIVEQLSDYERWKVHDRHISMEECKSIGLKVQDLAGDPQLDPMKNALLSYHHACEQTLQNDPNIGKFVENHLGKTIYTKAESQKATMHATGSLMRPFKNFNEYVQASKEFEALENPKV